MTGGAIASAIIIAVILIGGLCICFSQMGKHGKWKD